MESDSLHVVHRENNGSFEVLRSQVLDRAGMRAFRDRQKPRPTSDSVAPPAERTLAELLPSREEYTRAADAMVRHLDTLFAPDTGVPRDPENTRLIRNAAEASPPPFSPASDCKDASSAFFPLENGKWNVLLHKRFSPGDASEEDKHAEELLPRLFEMPAAAQSSETLAEWGKAVSTGVRRHVKNGRFDAEEAYRDARVNAETASASPGPHVRPASADEAISKPAIVGLTLLGISGVAWTGYAIVHGRPTAAAPPLQAPLLTVPLPQQPPTNTFVGTPYGSPQCGPTLFYD